MHQSRPIGDRHDEQSADLALRLLTGWPMTPGGWGDGRGAPTMTEDLLIASNPDPDSKLGL